MSKQRRWRKRPHEQKVFINKVKSRFEICGSINIPFTKEQFNEVWDYIRSFKGEDN